VDSDKLVRMFEHAGLGLRAVQVLEVDRLLLEEFTK
jgi:hypothetical protein